MRKFGFERLEPRLLVLMPAENVGGQFAVDGRACHLFQKRGPVAPFGKEEAGKAPLRQKRGLGEAFEVHAGELFHLGGHVVDLVGQREAFGVEEFVAGRLKLAVGPAPCLALAPAASEIALRGAEGHVGKAVARAAAHDVVTALAYPAEAGRTAVEGKAYGVENGAFARPRGPGDGENAVRFVFGGAEVDAPFTGKGVQVAEAQAQDAHGTSSSLLCWKSRTASA